MRALFFVTALVGGVAFSSLAAAQDVVSRSVVDGKTVELLSDFTWRYEEPASDGCDKVATGVEFCGEAEGWRRQRSGAGRGTPMYVFGGRHFALIVPEEFGKEHGVTHELAWTGIMNNASTGLGVNVEDIKQFETQDIEIDGRKAKIFNYAFNAKGADLVFYNASMITEKRNFQFVYYTLAKEPTPELAAMHKKVLSFIKFVE